MAAVFIIWMLAAVISVFGNNTLEFNKEVIVHLYEWKYSDIADECEHFLASHGYKGIQISPPSENLVKPGRPWHERYQPVSYRLTTRSGTEEELVDMLRRCNKVGIRVFADAVFNHMTAAVDVCQGTGGSVCDEKSMYYPSVPYTRLNFHQPCSIHDYKNKHEVRTCELVGLHDLDQSQEFVRQRIVDYLNHLTALGIAGFRIDAAKHMDPTDLVTIYSKLLNLNTEKGFPPNTKPLIYQEVIPDPDGVGYDEYTSLGLVTDFSYGYDLGRTFKGKKNLAELQQYGLTSRVIPNNQSIVFIENHDTEREGHPDILNYKNPQPYKMAIAFMLAWPLGIPNILSSYKFSSFNDGPPQDSNEQVQSSINGSKCSNGWVCQHRWRQVYNMVTFHNVVKDTEVKSWWDNGKDQVAFCRGRKGFVAFNLEKYQLNQQLQTCLPQGTYCDVITGSLDKGRCTGKTVFVNDDGTANITINEFGPNSQGDGVLAIHIDARLHERTAIDKNIS